MVTLNDLIICLHISKPDFSPTNSFPWKPKGDSIKAASELGLLRKEKCWYQLKRPTDFTLRGIHFDVATYQRELVKHALYVIKVSHASIGLPKPESDGIFPGVLDKIYNIKTNQIGNYTIAINCIQ